MKRKLPVLIAIVLALIISLAACQSQPAPGGNPTQPPLSPSQNPAPTQETTLPMEPVSVDTQPAQSKYITVEEAIAIALKDANLKEGDVTGLHGELERDNGVTIYDVDFYKDGTEYDYEIHAETGKILKPVKKEETTDADKTSSSNKTTTSNKTSSSNKTTTGKTTASKQLTKDQAISKALSHAGLKKSQVRDLEADLDHDDGVTLYEVNFETAEWEYEYEINAKTGKIIKAEKDRND